MLSNHSVPNKKPRDLAVTKSQGTRFTANVHYNFTPMLEDSKSRYEKGMGLYKSGRVSIGPNGFFKVSGFQVDTEKMTCTCPDYRTRKEPCKHLFAAMLFVKNSGKQKIEGLNGNPKTEPKDTANKPVEAQKQADNKPFDRQSNITRLAVLNTATEILKTHGKPVELTDVVSIASQLEQWALGS
ncbi:MAG: SWIM zinc finger family protein [Ignavibacteriales bacterium]